MKQDKPAPDRVRIDKWLWAARFFKTRNLAKEAVEGGKVKVGGERVKPARDLKPGDVLEIRIGDMDWTVTVAALTDQRGPAPQARLLYQEDPDSQARRQQQMETKTWVADPGSAIKGRPTKRDRRMIHRFSGG